MCSNKMERAKLIDDDSHCATNYLNGGIQMNILSSSTDTVSDDQLLNDPIPSTIGNDPDYSSIGGDNSTYITNIHSATGNGKAPALHSSTVVRQNSHSPTCLHSNTLTTSLATLRNRSAFANNRSASSDVPGRQKPTVENTITRPNSHSGPLHRFSSLDQATQTAARGSSGRLDDRGQRYESAISDIGVEYMKATGGFGIKFKQLQKPHGSQESLHSNSPSQLLNIRGASAHTVNDKTDIEKASAGGCQSTIISLYNDSSTDPMTATQLSNHDSHVKNTAEEPNHHHIGYRLGRRKFLAERRRQIADLCCGFALSGLLLMIIETECQIAMPQSVGDTRSYVLKGLITCSTVVLLALIAVYHAVEVQLFVVDNCIEDWRIAMSWKRVTQIVVELIICSVHPPPISYIFKWTILDIKTGIYRSADVPLDVVLSLPMFIRLYIIIRVMLLHSKLFTDASSRSIGALNKITFNTRFVLKTLMTIFPGTVLGVFMMSLWIVCAWTLRACENYHDDLFKNFLNALYLVAITFLSVGYGDFVPHTYCGRLISVVSGLMGAGCTALVVAVIAKKLELTRAEKHVHNFMLETQLSKKLKDAAANVLRETWLIYKYTKLVRRVNGQKVRSHQRKFLRAIQELRLVKLKQRKLTDQANSLTDFAKTTAQVHDIVIELKSSQNSADDRIEKIESAILCLQNQIENLPTAIARVMLEKQLSQASFVSASELQSPQALRSRPRGRVIQQSSFDSCA